jgi:hypothetical protein
MKTTAPYLDITDQLSPEYFDRLEKEEELLITKDEKENLIVKKENLFFQTQNGMR